ncbi:Imm61 family immunity protein [Microbacterium sp. Yaish 1]|uniref:Imm61 family immunity protein n=1 Tax=Microbacterium sp. Yaish 1 TaxID=2025014 RepID=UPI000B945B19|nr:Imm61 family immunity protein [Microbacterium sp. Yaish 1]OYC97434.1 hypothetical protein CI089_02505 [Microbacterium sp. Yaish 1]
MSATSDREFAFSSEFREWARRAGYSVALEENRIVIFDVGGEIRYYVGAQSGDYVVTRADRSEAERFVLSARAFVDVERYLTRALSVDARAAAGLSPVKLPFDEESVAPGYETVTLADGLAGLTRSTGEVRGVRFADRFVHPAVQYSYYADADLADLRRSLEAPDGAPLFTRYVS